MEGCPFCAKYAWSRTNRSDLVYEDEFVVAFPAIRPAAPVHLLIVPKIHVENVMELQNENYLGRMLGVAGQLARQFKISETGFRLIMNTGDDAHQTVPHLHLHLLGGRDLKLEGF